MRFAILGWNDGNVGDAIQTIAAKELLERNGHETVIVKDDLPELDVDAYFVNGFFACPVNPTMPTIYASCYFEQSKIVPKNTVVGCRDYATMERVKEAGSVPFYTGCLTLSLQREISNNGKTLSVDVPGEHWRTHIGFTDWDAAFAQAEINLKDYAACDTVHTNKIHVALPSVAFGKRVIFDDTGIDRTERLNGLGHLFTDRTDVPQHKAWWEDFAKRLAIA